MNCHLNSNCRGDSNVQLVATPPSAEQMSDSAPSNGCFKGKVTCSCREIVNYIFCQKDDSSEASICDNSRWQFQTFNLPSNSLEPEVVNAGVVNEEPVSYSDRARPELRLFFCANTGRLQYSSVSEHSGTIRMLDQELCQDLYTHVAQDTRAMLPGGAGKSVTETFV